MRREVWPDHVRRTYFDAWVDSASVRPDNEREELIDTFVNHWGGFSEDLKIHLLFLLSPKYCNEALRWSLLLCIRATSMSLHSPLKTQPPHSMTSYNGTMSETKSGRRGGNEWGKHT